MVNIDGRDLKERKLERKEEILRFLKPYNDDNEINPNDENTLKKVYEGIKKIYKGTFKSYMNIIKNFIKKHVE